MKLRNIMVEMRAYSMSSVALKAMNMRDTNLIILLSKRTVRFFGIPIAFAENKPWYMMMRAKRIG
jgi:hypothetical protein